MTPNPDFTPVGFAATDAPDAIVRRRRNPVWLALALVLAGAGLAGIALFVAAQVENAPDRGEAFENGGSAHIRGARQGASVTVEDRSTVGSFDAPEGAVALSCRLLPFGRHGNRHLLSTERSFFVTRGRPGVGFVLWVGMFAGAFALFLAPFAWSRYRAGSLGPR